MISRSIYTWNNFVAAIKTRCRLQEADVLYGIAGTWIYSREAKGAIAVSECPPDGKYVQLENEGTKVSYR